MIEGKVFKFGPDVNTDLIIAGRYSNLPSLEEKAGHVFEDIEPDFLQTFTPGGIIVAGDNFGCGSSREVAATVLKVIGVAAIVASSFGRTFFRNAVNIGLPIFQVQGIDKGFDGGDGARIDPENGEIANLTSGQRFETDPLPEFLLDIIAAGGLANYININLARESGMEGVGTKQQ